MVVTKENLRKTARNLRATAEANKRKNLKMQKLIVKTKR
jgi:hypothetical protein